MTSANPSGRKPIPFVVYKFAGALAALFLILFLLVHLYGNLFLLQGPEVYNQKSRELVENPLVRVVEVLLILAFLTHIVVGVVLTIRNRKARLEPYRTIRWKTPFYRRTLWLSGAVILMFLVLHLLSFTVPYRITGEVVDLYQEVADHFEDPIYTGVYILAFLFLGMHLFHGVDSIVQTLGIYRESRLGNILRSLGYAVALFLTLGYIFVALYMYLLHGLQIQIF